MKKYNKDAINVRCLFKMGSLACIVPLIFSIFRIMQIYVAPKIVLLEFVSQLNIK